MLLLNPALHKILVCSTTWSINCLLVKHSDSIECISFILACCQLMLFNCTYHPYSTGDRMSICIWLSRFQKPGGGAILRIYQLWFIAGMRQCVWFRIQYLLNASQWSVRVPRSVMLHPGKWVCSVTFSLGSFLLLLKIVESLLAGSTIYKVYSNNNLVVLEGLMNIGVSNGVIAQQFLNPTWLRVIQKKQTFRKHISGPSHAYAMGIWIWWLLKSFDPIKWFKSTGTQMNPLQ